MEFRLLGPMAVVPDCLSVPTAPKPRKVLALLLLHANRPVPVSLLVEELWDEHPPASAIRTLQTYIFQLRRHFAVLDEPPGHRFITTGASSYLLRVEDGALDVQAFQRLSAEGRALLRTGRPEEAGELLAHALTLWSGPALADIALGRPLQMHAVRLEEDRHAVLEARIEADLLSGRRHHELIGELSSLLVADPLNEGICHRLMTVLSLSGRRSESITVYHRLRCRLAEEFGMDPCGELRDLYERVLRDDLTAPRTRESVPL